MITSMSKIGYIQVRKKNEIFTAGFVGRKGHNLHLGEGKGNPISLCTLQSDFNVSCKCTPAESYPEANWM